jgi:hypothetical protein
MEKRSKKIAGTKLKISDGEQKNGVKYNGEVINIEVFQGYGGESKPDAVTITGMTTTSKKFRTKSGMGVGSTGMNLSIPTKIIPYSVSVRKWMIKANVLKMQDISILRI